MSVEQIYIKGDSKLYIAEKDLVSGGVNICRFNLEGRNTSVAKIVDDGAYFNLVTFPELTKIRIDQLRTDVKARLKDGSEPPQEIHEQIEIVTNHNRKLIVRPVSSKETCGVIVFYSDEDSVLWSLAYFRLVSPDDSLLISLPKKS